MTLFGWFGKSAEKEFGCSLAEMLAARISLDVKQMPERKLEKKHEAMMNKLEQQVAIYTREHKLSVYKRARIGQGFKSTLLEKGYDSAYVNQVTSWLMLKV